MQGRVLTRADDASGTPFPRTPHWDRRRNLTSSLVLALPADPAAWHDTPDLDLAAAEVIQLEALHLLEAARSSYQMAVVLAESRSSATEVIHNEPQWIMACRRSYDRAEDQRHG